MRSVPAFCMAALMLAAPSGARAEETPVPASFASQIIGEIGLSTKECPAVIADDPVMTTICIESDLDFKPFRKAWDNAVSKYMGDYPGLESTTGWLKSKKSHSRTYSIGKYFMIIQFGHKTNNVIFLYFKPTL